MYRKENNNRQNGDYRSRNDQRYRSTARGNNGVLENSRGYNYVNHDSSIYEDEFGDRNNPGYGRYRMRSSESVYGNPYGYYQGNVNDNTAHSYNSYERDRYNGGRSYRDDDRNFFERAGDKIRETWNDWTDNDDNDYDRGRRSNGYSERYYNGNGNGHGSRYNNRHDDRNIFQRGADKIREVWNDFTDDDDDDRYSRRSYSRDNYDNDNGYGRQNYERSSRSYGMDGRSYGNGSRRRDVGRNMGRYGNYNSPMDF
jgi:hypothetical protein